jgi:hypothetical protein
MPLAHTGEAKKDALVLLLSPSSPDFAAALLRKEKCCSLRKRRERLPWPSTFLASVGWVKVEVTKVYHREFHRPWSLRFDKWKFSIIEFPKPRFVFLLFYIRRRG